MMYVSKIFRNEDEEQIVICTTTMEACIISEDTNLNIGELYKDGWCFSEKLGEIIRNEYREEKQIKREFYEVDNILIVELENGARYKEFWEYGQVQFIKLREARV